MTDREHKAGLVINADGTRTIRVVMRTQPTPNTCVHACLAAVTGADVHNLIRRFGDKAIGKDEERCVLIEHGLFPVARDHEYFFNTPATYLITMPSLNRPGGSHRLVAINDGVKQRVLDPMEFYGESVRYYPQDILDVTYNGELDRSFFEITELDMFKLRFMEGGV